MPLHPLAPENPERAVRGVPPVPPQSTLIGSRYRLARSTKGWQQAETVLARYNAADSVALQPGSTLGPYEVLALIGAGGMGEVYRASDTLDRTVAIKGRRARLGRVDVPPNSTTPDSSDRSGWSAGSTCSWPADGHSRCEFAQRDA